MPLVNGTGNGPSPGRPTPGVVKQDKSSGGSVDTTKTLSGPQRVRMSSGERPIGAAKGKQSDTEALCQTPPPPPLLTHGWATRAAHVPPRPRHSPRPAVMGGPAQPSSAQACPSHRTPTSVGPSLPHCPSASAAWGRGLVAAPAALPPPTHFRRDGVGGAGHVGLASEGGGGSTEPPKKGGGGGVGKGAQLTISSDSLGVWRGTKVRTAQREARPTRGPEGRGGHGGEPRQRRWGPGRERLQGGSPAAPSRRGGVWTGGVYHFCSGHTAPPAALAPPIERRVGPPWPRRKGSVEGAVDLPRGNRACN